jgi:hypothetical protein
MKKNNFKNYIRLAFTYGFIRKYVYTKDVEYKRIEYKKIYTSPILYTDYFLFSTFSGFRTLFMFPYEILRDIRQIEMKIRNIKPIEQPEKDISFLSILRKID